MPLKKEKNNTHKQRTLPNDERLFRGSNVHATDPKMAFIVYTHVYAALM